MVTNEPATYHFHFLVSFLLIRKYTFGQINQRQSINALTKPDSSQAF
jgi:hypothetical protein